MRTVTVTVARPGLPPARYRVAFADDRLHAMAVTYLREGGQARSVAISTPTARAAIAAALLQLTPPPAPIARRDPAAADTPYAALEALARSPRQKERA